MKPTNEAITQPQPVLVQQPINSIEETKAQGIQKRAAWREERRTNRLRNNARTMSFGTFSLRESLFSNSNKDHNTRGMINLIALIMVSLNARDLLLFFQSFNLVPASADFKISLFFETLIRSPCFQCFWLLLLFPHISFLLEVVALISGNRISVIATCLCWCNVVSCILLPTLFLTCFSTTQKKSQFSYFSSFVVFLSELLAAKLHSYHHVNLVLRSTRKKLSLINLQQTTSSQQQQQQQQQLQSDGPVSSDSDTTGTTFHSIRRTSLSPSWPIPMKAAAKYPRNLTFSDLYYFLVAPTLCYDVEYALKEHISWMKFFVSLLEFILSASIFSVLFNRDLIPTMKAALDTFSAVGFRITDLVVTIELLEKLMKVATNIVVLLLLFTYSAFHALLNAIAEITKFGDRFFYSDWWNSCGIEDFLRLFSPPLNDWTLRHAFIPLRNIGLPYHMAIVFCFSLGAVLLELVVMGSSKLHTPWILLSVLLEYPITTFLSSINRRRHTNSGNMAFWINLFVWVLCLSMLYFRDCELVTNSKTLLHVTTGRHPDF